MQHSGERNRHFCFTERFFVVSAINPSFSPLKLVILSYATCQKWMDTSRLVCLPSSSLLLAIIVLLSSLVTDRSLAALPVPLEFPFPLAHSSAGCLCWPARRLCCFETCFSGGCCRIIFGFSPVSSIQVRVWELGWVMMPKLTSPVYPVLPLPSSKPETRHAGMRMECRCGTLKRQHWHDLLLHCTAGTHDVAPFVSCWFVEFLFWKKIYKNHWMMTLSVNMCYLSQKNLGQW